MKQLLKSIDSNNDINCNKQRENYPCISLVDSCNNSKNLNKYKKGF